MRFLLDESVDARLASFLVNHGHDVEIVGRDYANALGDNEVLEIANREQRILLTNDRDFGELVFRSARNHAGVVLLRLRTRQLKSVEARMERLLGRYAQDITEFVVVTDSRIRVRSR